MQYNSIIGQYIIVISIITIFDPQQIHSPLAQDPDEFLVLPYPQNTDVD